MNPSEDSHMYNLESLCSEQDFLYMTSLKETDGLAKSSVVKSNKEEIGNTSFENFNSTIDFSPEIYKELRKQYAKQSKKNTHNLSKGIRSSISEYYLRSSSKFC